MPTDSWFWWLSDFSLVYLHNESTKNIHMCHPLLLPSAAGPIHQTTLWAPMSIWNYGLMELRNPLSRIVHMCNSLFVRKCWTPMTSTQHRRILQVFSLVHCNTGTRCLSYPLALSRRTLGAEYLSSYIGVGITGGAAAGAATTACHLSEIQ